MKTKLLLTAVSLSLNMSAFAFQDSNLVCPAQVTCSQEIYPNGMTKTTCDNDKETWEAAPKPPYNNYDKLAFQLQSVYWVSDHYVITNACEYQNGTQKIELDHKNYPDNDPWYPQDPSLWNIKQDPTDPWKFTGQCMANNPCYMATTPSR